MRFQTAILPAATACITSAAPMPDVQSSSPSSPATLELSNRASLVKASAVNYCSFTAYVARISGSISSLITLAPGKSYGETYHTGSGVTLKVAMSTSFSDAIQFEYGIQGSEVFYDLSNVNGNGFPNYPVSLATSDGTCTSVYCAPGDSLCQN